MNSDAGKNFFFGLDVLPIDVGGMLQAPTISLSLFLLADMII